MVCLTAVMMQTYLYEAENPIMQNTGWIIFGKNGTDQDPFNKIL